MLVCSASSISTVRLFDSVLVMCCTEGITLRTHNLWIFGYFHRYRLFHRREKLTFRFRAFSVVMIQFEAFSA